MKSGTLGFSFGYMVIDAVKRSDGKREIRALDVFEVSATTVPMNAGTRVLSTKAIAAEYDRVRREYRDHMLKLLTHDEPGADAKRSRVNCRSRSRASSASA